MTRLRASCRGRRSVRLLGRHLLRLLLLAAPLVVLCAGCAGLPGSTGSGSPTIQIVTHTVSPGESLRTIADDYYGDPEAAAYLAKVNDISKNEVLTNGGLIDVPVGRQDLARYRDRTEAKVFYNRGTILADSGDTWKALEAFSEALKIDPDFVDARYNMGVVLLREGELPEAVDELESVVRARPGDAASAFALGKAYYDSGREKDALLQFSRALELDPGHEDALFASAVTLEKLGREEEAFVRFVSYLAKFPGGRWVDFAKARVNELATE